MARKKIPVCVEAAKASLWFCDDDHLHIEMTDHNDNPLATIQFSLDDGMEIVADLVAELGFILVDPDDVEGLDDDEIGPVMGSA